MSLAARREVAKGFDAGGIGAQLELKLGEFRRQIRIRVPQTAAGVENRGVQALAGFNGQDHQVERGG